MRDPETYLTARGIALLDHLDAKKSAQVDSLHRVRLNYEFYFFADEEERAGFVRDPIAACGLLTDPVSRTRFRPTPQSPRTEHAGIPFYFESAANLHAFAAMPDSFLLPRPRMQPLAPAPPAK